MNRPYRSPWLPGAALPHWSGESLDGAPWCAADWPVVAVAEGTATLGTAEVWLRLLASAGHEAEVALAVLDAGRQDVLDAVPRSRWGRSFLVRGEGFGGAWAWCEGYGAVLGAPTEDAWDAFREAAVSALGDRERTRRGRPSEA